MEKLSNFAIYAWVGEDEFGSGELGLKQGFVCGGLIPLVSVSREKLMRPDIETQMEAQADECGKRIFLCRFEFAGFVHATKGGESPQ